MKTLNLWSILLCTLCLTHLGFAKKYIPPTCEQKIETVKAQIENISSLEQIAIEELIAFIEPCITDGYQEALYLRDVLTLEIATTAAEIAQALAFLEETANAGSIDAQRKLGLYYKTTVGSINLDKSLDYFTMAANQGDEFSKYALGYFKLKGLAGENQNYTNALQSFATSTHPMARHWEGICNYSGYGLPENKEKGKQILNTNNIINSQQLFQFLNGGYSNIFIHRFWNFRKAQDLDYINQFDPNANNLSVQDMLGDELSGTIIEYDWSGQKIKRALLIISGISINNDTNKVQVGASSRDNEGFGVEGEFSNNTFTTSNFHFSSFRVLYPDYLDNNQSQLSKYDITKITFNKIRSTLNPSKQAIVGRLEGTISVYNEPIPPMYLIIDLNGGFIGRSTAAFSENTSLILENQITKPTITKVNPNPFKDLFTVHYGIIQRGKVQLKVFNTLGNLAHTTKVVAKEKGMHSQSFNGSTLPAGIYAVHLMVDGLLQNRFTLIKE